MFIRMICNGPFIFNCASKKVSKHDISVKNEIIRSTVNVV